MEASGDGAHDVNTELAELRARLDAVEARLFDIRGLARKHRVEPDALAALGDELAGKLKLIEAGGERIAALESEPAAAFLPPPRTAIARTLLHLWVDGLK